MYPNIKEKHSVQIQPEAAGKLVKTKSDRFYDLSHLKRVRKGSDNKVQIIISTYDWIISEIFNQLEDHNDSDCLICKQLLLKYELLENEDFQVYCKIKAIQDLIILSNERVEVDSSQMIKEEFIKLSNIAEVSETGIGIRSVYNKLISNINSWPMSFKQGSIKEVDINEEEHKILHSICQKLVHKIAQIDYDPDTTL